jgi:hypothetical protein
LAYLSVKNIESKIVLISTQHGMPEPVRMKWKILKEICLLKYNIYILSKYFNKLIAVSDEIKTTLLKSSIFLIIKSRLYITERQ